MPRPLIEQFDVLIRRDPARRGLIGSEPQSRPLCGGHLAQAAAHLAEFAQHVGLVTGFFVPGGQPPAAETDGPPGTLLLAKALEAVGIQTTLITDENCAGAVAAAAEATGFPADKLLVSPHGSTLWRDDFFSNGPGRNLTHLIAIERVGPSHTSESFRNQPRKGPAPRKEFSAQVPADAYNRCHNMRGEIIDDHTSDLYRLFDDLHRYRPDAKTIGIGDGGNEIGMGSVLWEELQRRLEGEQAGRILCRVATDWNIVAGTSNWGGYALAAATLVLRGQAEVLRDWGREDQQQVLQHMVTHGPAVDGMTGRQEATVDGLPFLTFIQPWEGIRRLLGFED